MIIKITNIPVTYKISNKTNGLLSLELEHDNYFIITSSASITTVSYSIVKSVVRNMIYHMTVILILTTQLTFIDYYTKC